MSAHPDTSTDIGADIWTVGHWTCPEQTFVGLLRNQHIELLVDVRSAPGSRTSPHFNRDAMPEWLRSATIDYRHLPELGGRRPRRPEAGDRNAGWRNSSFRNYADYTLTPEYERGIAELEALAREQRVAYLCAEPMPWRCHRLLVSNTLSARGWSVHHIIGERGTREHKLGQWGATPVIDEHGRITYPPVQD
jgi:uncharacterized protein (DUF488 family)